MARFLPLWDNFKEPIYCVISFFIYFSNQTVRLVGSVVIYNQDIYSIKKIYLYMFLTLLYIMHRTNIIILVSDLCNNFRASGSKYGSSIWVHFQFT